MPPYSRMVSVRWCLLRVGWVPSRFSTFLSTAFTCLPPFYILHSRNWWSFPQFPWSHCFSIPSYLVSLSLSHWSSKLIVNDMTCTFFNSFIDYTINRGHVNTSNVDDLNAPFNFLLYIQFTFHSCLMMVRSFSPKPGSRWYNCISLRVCIHFLAYKLWLVPRKIVFI